MAHRNKTKRYTQLAKTEEGCPHLNTKNIDSWKMPDGNYITEQCTCCLMFRGKTITPTGGVLTGKWRNYA